jgi:hypothetical protein
MTELKKPYTERRRGPDVVVKAVWWTVGISWILIISAFLITIEARPKFETFIDRMVKARVRDYWDTSLLQYTFYVLIINLAVCIIGFIFNMLRKKRKTDKISKSIIVLGCITMSGIIWCMLR